MLLCAGSLLHAQPSVSAKKITLTCEKVPFEQALQRVAQQAGVFFAYSVNFAEANRPVSFSVRNESMENVIIRICNQMGFLYKQQGKHFILKKKPAVSKPKSQRQPPPTTPKQTSPNQSRTNTTREPVKVLPAITSPSLDTTQVTQESSAPATIAVSDSGSTLMPDTDTLLVVDLTRPDSKTDTVTATVDSVLTFLFGTSRPSRRIVTPTRVFTYQPRVPPKPYTGDGLELFLFGNRERILPQSDTLQADTLPSDILTRASVSSPEKSLSASQFNRFRQWRLENGGFIVRTGLYVNEVTYLGAEVQLGLRFVFGIVNAGFTTNGITRIGYGAGVLVPVSRKWSIGAEWTVAHPQKKVFFYDKYLEDNATIHLASWHQRFQAVIRWRASKRIELTLSPTFNWMNTRYQMAGESLPFLLQSSSPFIGDQPSAQITSIARSSATIAPPYTFYDSYSDSRSFSVFYPDLVSTGYFRNTKLWIGGQVGFFYTFSFLKRRS